MRDSWSWRVSGPQCPTGRPAPAHWWCSPFVVWVLASHSLPWDRRSVKAGPLGTWVQGKPEGGGRTAGELRAAGCGADGREPEPAGIARLPRQSPRPWQVPRRPASVVSVKQEDNSNSSPLLPPLSLRIPTVSCPACRRSNRQKEQPPREREWGAVPSCSGQTLRKQPPCFSTHSILHFWKICPWIRSVPQAGHAALGSLGVRSQPRSQAPALDSLDWAQGLFSDGTRAF